MHSIVQPKSPHPSSREVRALVSMEVAGLRESLLAHAAHVRPLSGVNSLVGLQVRQLVEAPSTNLTLVRPSARVDALVHLQVAGGREHFRAEPAGMGFRPKRLPRSNRAGEGGGVPRCFGRRRAGGAREHLTEGFGGQVGEAWAAKLRHTCAGRGFQHRLFGRWKLVKSQVRSDGRIDFQPTACTSYIRANM